MQEGLPHLYPWALGSLNFFQFNYFQNWFKTNSFSHNSCPLRFVAYIGVVLKLMDSPLFHCNVIIIKVKCFLSFLISIKYYILQIVSFTTNINTIIIVHINMANCNIRYTFDNLDDRYVAVRWDSGSVLSLIQGKDQYEIVE